MKTNKFLLKRFRITKNKKMMHLPPGQDHFLAKKSGNKTRAVKTKSDFPVLAKTLKKLLKK